MDQLNNLLQYVVFKQNKYNDFLAAALYEIGKSLLNYILFLGNAIGLDRQMEVHQNSHFRYKNPLTNKTTYVEIRPHVDQEFLAVKILEIGMF